MKAKSLSEWLFFLENQHSQEIQLGLSRVREVAITLELIDLDATIITVGGTNGKGSTVALLESMYREANYQVASYTSPHLHIFNERIKINQQPINDEPLVKAFEIIDQAKGLTHLTYFEMTTLAALWYFKQHALDVIILEVGLGGRLDATNIIDSDIAIITTVALDHEFYLGNTLDAIGFEKAGILREGKPFIYADKNPPATVLAKSQGIGAISYICGEHYEHNARDYGIDFFYHQKLMTLPSSKYHVNTVAAAVMATLILQETLPLTDKQRQNGVQNTFLPARLQLVDTPCPTLFDVAHNPQAADYLAYHLQTYYPGKKIHAVFSALADKDINGIISPFKKLLQNWYISELPSTRAATTAQLLAALDSCELKLYLCYNNPISAYQAACAAAKSDELIVVFGSFLTVSMVWSTLLHSNTLSEKL